MTADDPAPLPGRAPGAWTRRRGEEPIPGYRLQEPLGQGGFGEVWKCEAPGGFDKAIKFVRPDGPGGSPAAQELRALQRVKAIRHPFILSLDRVEAVDGILTIVMELADQSLQGLMAQRQASGLLGVPREELLGYMREAAEALDWMNFEHGLQHLDIKPPNLFVVAGHVKIADFGLVDLVDPPGTPTHEGPTDQTPLSFERRPGVTPLYAAPERFRGNVSGQSDQYSLAIVYQQLLTGTVPFWSPSGYQVMMLHLTEEPNLVPLPSADRDAVARALSKDPRKRFGSCGEFVLALAEGSPFRLAARAGSVPAAASRAEGEGKRSETRPGEGNLAPRPSASATTVRVRPGPLPRTPGEGSSPPARPVGSLDTPAVSQAPTEEQSGFSRKGPVGKPPGPATSALSLPGYRFLKCHAQTPFADLWSATGPDGATRRALSLAGAVCSDPDLPARLRSLMHPALPPIEILHHADGRLVLVTDPLGKTLRDRFEECREEGEVGIPREELLDVLGQAAEVLDLLAEDLGLAHLGLNPSSLFYRGGRIHIADFGVLALAAGPVGMLTGPFNPRYAAPELARGGHPDGRSVDLFALALIYAEMLTGVAPRPLHKGGPDRSPGRFVSSGRTRRGKGRRDAARFDLDLLPVHDRKVVARALSEDRGRRYRRLTDWVTALRRATPGRKKSTDPYDCLPPVIPFGILQGKPPSRGMALPTTRQFLESLAIQTPGSSPGGAGPGRFSAFGQTTPTEGDATDCRLGPDGTWESVFPLVLPPGHLGLKVQSFRRHWGARLLHQDEEGCDLLLELGEGRHGGSVEVRLRRRPPSPLPHTEGSPHRCEVHVSLRPAGRRPRAAELLRARGAELLGSLVRALEAKPDQRTDPRFPCPAALVAYPVLPDLRLGEVLKGTGKDLSLGGICFRVPRLLSSDRLYLHWPQLRAGRDFAVLARVVRIAPDSNGVEVGAYFPGARAPDG